VVVCTNETAVFVIDATPEATIQWQFKNESGTFENLADGGPFTGTSTPNLTVQAIGNYLNGTVFRAKLTREGNGCDWFSNEVTLNVNALPQAVSADLRQCDPSSTNGLSVFNLALAVEMFTAQLPGFEVVFFTDDVSAQNPANALPMIYGNVQPMQLLSVLVRNPETGCTQIGTLRLIVDASPMIVLPAMTVCENVQAEDGFESFDLTSANIPLGPNQMVTYFRSTTDALLV